MFERRLRWFVILMSAVALATVARLVDIQVVRAEHYEALADRILTRSPDYLPAPRGSIRDRNGEVLLSDEPASDISLRYEVLVALLSDAPPAASRTYLRAVARELRKGGRYPKDMPTNEIVAELAARFEPMLNRLSTLTFTPRSALVERAKQVQRRVERIKAVVQHRSPTVRMIKEERRHHALIPHVDEATALAVRIELEADHPWLRVVPSSRRVAHDADALVHVLGRTGSASPQRIATDPLRGDELRGLGSGDTCGISGIERVAELTLRGTHGRIVEDFDHTVLERIDPVRGGDVMLTIEADLQRRVLEVLKEAVAKREGTKEPAGGASAVVVDVATRELLALVSYPVYGYDDYRENYTRLARDKRWQPLRFRAVANIYPPGSTCKVIGLYGGLAEGLVNVDERIHCTGHLLANQPNKFRCWIYNRYPGVTHDMRGNPAGQDAEDAVRNSCNMYFYTVGDRLGVDRLCKWFSQFGLGRTQGTGLIEESPGIVPTSQWIAENRKHDRRVRPADAWNFSIGQGEVSATPLQAANVAATVASGRWEPVKLVRDSAGNLVGGEAATPVVFDEQYLHILRVGMWRVVNERGATAFMARLNSDDHVMCGKTGSAEASRRVIRKKYTLAWPDGRTQEVIATSKHEALARFGDEKPEVIAEAIYELFPPRGPEGKLPSHAWFIGYTQPKSTPRGAAPRGRSYALSVIVEFGGSGGRVAGPVAKAIAEMLVQRK
ncbi:MAG: penicillin-binding transpeptidase domain-containing protein [Phycisphaerae bacterium]